MTPEQKQQVHKQVEMAGIYRGEGNPFALSLACHEVPALLDALEASERRESAMRVSLQVVTSAMRGVAEVVSDDAEAGTCLLCGQWKESGSKEGENDGNS